MGQLLGNAANRALDMYKNVNKKAMDALKKEGKYLLNIEKSCGIPNVVTVHIWNNLMILDAFIKFVLYYTNWVYDRFILREGVLSMPAMMLSVLPLACLYAYFCCAGNERPYVLTLLYKLHMMLIGTIAVAYIFDASIFCLDKSNFCKL